MTFLQSRNRKAEQAAETRSLLVAEARKLFAERGYAGASIDDIAERVSVTIGAVYHHFRDKRELFRAVYDDVQHDLGRRIRSEMRSHVTSASHEWDVIAGAHAFLDSCSDPAIQRIVLLEARSVLPFDASREISHFGLDLIRGGLQRAIDQGIIEPQPVEPLAHLLRSAITEGAIFVAGADNQKSARAEVGAALDRLINGLRRST